MTQWQQENDPRRQPPATPPQWQQGAPPRQDPRTAPQYTQPAYQPQYPPPGPPPGPWQYGPQPPPRKSRKGLFALLGCGGAAALFILIAVIAGSSPSSSSPAASGQQTQAAAPPAHTTAAAKPAAARTVASFAGSGTQKTATFTVTSTWKLTYSFDCASFGYKGNFQVFTDGGSDFNGVTVNDLAMSKSASTYAYGDAGTHYLEVNSECSWTVKVTDEG